MDYSSLWGGRVIIGVLRWGWVAVILRVSLEVILLHLLRQPAPIAIQQAPKAVSPSPHPFNP